VKKRRPAADGVNVYVEGSEEIQREQFRRALISLRRLNLIALVAAIPFLAAVLYWLEVPPLPFAGWVLFAITTNRYQALFSRQALTRLAGPWDKLQLDLRRSDVVGVLVSFTYATPALAALAVNAPVDKWLMASMCVLGTIGANVGIGYGRASSFHLAAFPMAGSVLVSACVRGGELGVVVVIGTTIFGIATVMTNDQFCDVVRESIALRLQLESANLELLGKAETDELTQLPNRIALKSEYERAADISGQTGAVLFLDLDGFKEINDVHGHETGDLVLQTVANRLRTNLRPGDRAFRLGGDEFLVMVNSSQASQQIAVRLQEAIAMPMQLGDLTLEVGVSIGVAVVDRSATLAEAIAEADRLMYLEKAAARSSREQHRIPTIALP
jgi:diguanylate cyclase (GGDEF)-like protein